MISYREYYTSKIFNNAESSLPKHFLILSGETRLTLTMVCSLVEKIANVFPLGIPGTLHVQGKVLNLEKRGNLFDVSSFHLRNVDNGVNLAQTTPIFFQQKSVCRLVTFRGPCGGGRRRGEVTK